MPRPTDMPRDAIVGRLTELFRASGFQGVSLSDIARETGLGRSSLYHHFPGGKAEMAAAVLDGVADWAADNIIAPLESGRPRAERIDGMLHGVEEAYSGGGRACVVASLLVGCDESGLAGSVRGFVAGWRDALTRALVETGTPAEPAARLATDALARIQGALILSRALGDRAPFRQALRLVRQDLVAQP